MMKYFCEADTVWQVILLVLSLLSFIILTCRCALSFRHKHNTRKQILTSIALLLNATLYVVMQIDSRITRVEHTLHIPYALLFAVTLLFFLFTLILILYESKTQNTIDNTSIKESFDYLPTGVCFFNEAGLPVLCNYAMHRFSFAVCQRDIQYITDLQDCLNDDFTPVEGVTKDGKIFTLYGGSAWQLGKRTFTYDNGNIYTQFIAFDVTDLQQNRVELTRENDQLRKTQAELKKLSANMVTVTREEEILNTKMRVHDDMGRCLVEARKYLRDGGDSIPESVVRSWKRAVSMLKYNNETSDEDMMTQIRKTCETLKLSFMQTGGLPKDESTAYILTCAVRECVTNAVRYAEASELYAEFAETETLASVSVTNNGKCPDGDIREGGGLSTLRRRVERSGGTMTVQSSPKFKLTVTVPKGKDGMI